MRPAANTNIESSAAAQAPLVGGRGAIAFCAEDRAALEAAGIACFEAEGAWGWLDLPPKAKASLRLAASRAESLSPEIPLARGLAAWAAGKEILVIAPAEIVGKDLEGARLLARSLAVQTKARKVVFRRMGGE